MTSSLAGHAHPSESWRPPDRPWRLRWRRRMRRRARGRALGPAPRETTSGNTLLGAGCRAARADDALGHRTVAAFHCEAGAACGSRWWRRPRSGVRPVRTFRQAPNRSAAICRRATHARMRLSGGHAMSGKEAVPITLRSFKQAGSRPSAARNCLPSPLLASRSRPPPFLTLPSVKISPCDHTATIGG